MSSMYIFSDGMALSFLFLAIFMDSFKVKFIQICAIGTIRPIGPESFMLFILLSYIKLDEDRHKFIRSVMSSTVRLVRLWRYLSSFNSLLIKVMHFFRGIDGNRALVSKLTRYSSSFKVISLRL